MNKIVKISTSELQKLVKTYLETDDNISCSYSITDEGLIEVTHYSILGKTRTTREIILNFQ